MTIALQGSVAIGTEAGGPLTTGSYNLSGTNKHLIGFAFATSGTSQATVGVSSGMKWRGSGGDTLGTALVTQITTDVGLYLYSKSAPTDANSTVYGTFLDSSNIDGIAGFFCTDVDQSSAVRASNSATGTDAAPSVTLTGIQSGDLIIAAAVFWDADGSAYEITSNTSGLTRRQHIDFNNDWVSGYGGFAAGEKASTGTSHTLTWAISGAPNGSWSTIAIALKDVSGGGGGGPTYKNLSLLGVGT